METQERDLTGTVWVDTAFGSIDYVKRYNVSSGVCLLDEINTYEGDGAKMFRYETAVSRTALKYKRYIELIGVYKAEAEAIYKDYMEATAKTRKRVEMLVNTVKQITKRAR